MILINECHYQVILLKHKFKKKLLKPRIYKVPQGPYRHNDVIQHKSLWQKTTWIQFTQTVYSRSTTKRRICDSLLGNDRRQEHMSHYDVTTAVPYDDSVVVCERFLLILTHSLACSLINFQLSILIAYWFNITLSIIIYFPQKNNFQDSL